MTLSDLKVVRIVRGGNLHNARTLGHIRVLIAHNRNFLIKQRQNHVATVQMRIARILRIDRHRRITQHGFGTRSREFQLLAGLLDRIQQMPKMSVLLLVLHLGVRDRRVTMRAPVDHTVTAVNKSLLVQTHEHLFNRRRTTLVHGKAFALPVTARTQLFQLTDNTIAILIFPGPRTLQKAVAPEHLFGESFLAHGLHHFGFGRNGCVIRAGQPQRLIPLHTLKADQNILQGFVQGMSHM